MGNITGEQKVLEALAKFVVERDWDQFHSPENLAKSISIEAAELLECFQWNSKSDLERIEEELADVLTYAFLLSRKLGISPSETILKKLSQTASKYPVNKSRGTSKKYD